MPESLHLCVKSGQQTASRTAVNKSAFHSGKCPVKLQSDPNRRCGKKLLDRTPTHQDMSVERSPRYGDRESLCSDTDMITSARTQQPRAPRRWRSIIYPGMAALRFERQAKPRTINARCWDAATKRYLLDRGRPTPTLLCIFYMEQRPLKAIRMCTRSTGIVPSLSLPDASVQL